MALDEIRGARCLRRDRARAEPIGHDVARGGAYAAPGASSFVRERFSPLRHYRRGLVLGPGCDCSGLIPLLFVALFQTVADGQTTAGDAGPARVWLGSSGVFTRGPPVRVYVQAPGAGNLIVLHRRTDGRIEVLF